MNAFLGTLIAIALGAALGSFAATARLPKRQFGLRGLLVITTVVAVALGLISLISQSFQ